jgi:hypothetical protein
MAKCGALDIHLQLIAYSEASRSCWFPKAAFVCEYSYTKRAVQRANAEPEGLIAGAKPLYAQSDRQKNLGKDNILRQRQGS